MDMDLDDLDVPFVPAPRKPSRFLSKPKPQPQSIDDDDVTFPDTKKEEDELDTKLTSILPEVDVTNGVVKTEVVEDPMNVDPDDGEDCVVREIDVYFSPSVDENTQVYVMQYPLRPSWRPYDLDECCEEVRVRPKSVEVEVDLSVDVHSKNFDAGWASRMKRETAKEKRYDDDWVSKVKLDKQTLCSSWKPPCSTGYAIGILKGNKLHLNPIRAVLQLRPSMEHLKPYELVGKNDATSDVDLVVKSENFDKRESSGSSKTQGQLNGHPNEQKTTDKECWVPLQYHSSKSEYSANYIQKLMAEETCPIQFSMNPYDYVNSLCPGASNNSSSKGHSQKSFLSMPLEERLKKWLCEGNTQVHRFNSLKHIAPEVPVKEFLDVLQKYAILVQGLWVPKSGVVLGQQEAQQLLFRDYLLFLFSQSQNVSYSEINKFKQVLKARKMGSAKRVDFVQVINRFLKVLAIDRPDVADWKFKEPTDMLFIKLYPEIVEEQKKIWERSGTRLMQTVYGHNIGKSITPGVVKSSGTPMSSDKVAVKVENENHPKRTMSNEIREALPKALEILFKSHSVCSFQTICQGLKDIANYTSKTDPKMLATAKAAEASNEVELKSVLSEVAVNIHGVYVSKSSSSHPEYNPFRQVVINLLCAGGPNAKLRKGPIVEAAKIALKREVPPNEYKLVLQEICQSDKSVWVLKSDNGKSN